MPRRLYRGGKAGLSGLFCFLALVLPAVSVTAEPITIELTSAEVGYDQRTGEAVVSYKMSKASRMVFGRFTQENVGRKIELRVDGKTVTAPVIREPILGGVGQLSGHFTPQQARDIADRLSSGRSKLEMELAP
jgi:preprotein translocase subunit SecD